MYDKYGCAEDERRARDYEHAISNSDIEDKELLKVMINSKWNTLERLINRHADFESIYDALEDIEVVQEMIENNEAEGVWKDYCNDARYSYETASGFDWTSFERDWA